MLTSRPASEALTFAMSSISTSPVASTSPSITPPTRRSPSIYSCPIGRSRGPSWTELGWFGVGDDSRGGSSAAGGVGRLAAGLLLKVAHSDVAVQRRAVLDLQPLDLDVSVQLRRLGKGELVTSRELPLDLALDGDIGSFEQGLHDRSVPDLDVAADAKFAFGVAPVDGHAAAVGQLALEAVIGAERELLGSITLGVGLAVSLHWRAFHYSLLCFHERASPSLGISSDIGFSPKAGSQNTSGLDSFVLAILHLLPGNVR